MESTMAFRPLAQRDLDDLHVWLNRPHLARFFQTQAIGRAEVEAKYAPRIRGEVPTPCHLALYRDRPFGYLQCYRIADWPDWAAQTGLTEGIGVDLAILEPDMIGQGFGRAMLAAYLDKIAFPLFSGEHCAFIAHDLANKAAIRASTAAGFRPLRNFQEGDLTNVLLVCERRKADV
jgi:aminoglycoside 6'-N-acetyltransferase